MASTTILDNSKRIHSCYKLPQISSIVFINLNKSTRKIDKNDLRNTIVTSNYQKRDDNIEK